MPLKINEELGRITCSTSKDPDILQQSNFIKYVCSSGTEIKEEVNSSSNIRPISLGRIISCKQDIRVDKDRGIERAEDHL